MEEITARELTVKEAMGIMDGLGKSTELHPIEMMIDPTIPVAALPISTGKSLEELMEFPPSELKKIVEVVESANPFFMGMMEKLAKVGHEILQQLPENLKAVSPPSSPTGTPAP